MFQELIVNGQCIPADRGGSNNSRADGELERGGGERKVAGNHKQPGVNRRKGDLIQGGGPPPTNRINSYRTKFNAQSQLLIVIHVC